VTAVGRPIGRGLTVLVWMLLGLGAVLLAGCASRPVPSAVAPLLDGWRQIGVTCGKPTVGMPDNMPQWSCQATLRGVQVNLSVIGDDAGAAQLVAQIPAATDRETAIAVFGDLVSSMRAFPSMRTDLLAWVQSWDGSSGQVSTGFPGAHVAIEADPTWIGLYVSRIPYQSAPSPRAPASGSDVGALDRGWLEAAR
jgi:hypothetical protein